jgi:hypothetical protein
VCNKEEGIGVEDFVVEFLGEVGSCTILFVSVIPIIFTQVEWDSGSFLIFYVFAFF